MCLGAVSVSAIAESCTPAKQLTVPLTDNKLTLSLSSFKDKRYVVVVNDQLNYPIVVYRHAENDFTALLLRCSHQYNELNVNGDLLTCSAHGSEFNTKGEVVQGPAEMKLRSFSTTIEAQNLIIHLA